MSPAATVWMMQVDMTWICCRWGVGWCHSSLILVGMCCWKFEIGPIHIPNFKEKVTHSYTNQLIFKKNLKNWPIRIPNLHKGSLIYQEANFATHAEGMSYRVFCTEYPQSVAVKWLKLDLFHFCKWFKVNIFMLSYNYSTEDFLTLTCDLWCYVYMKVPMSYP